MEAWARGIRIAPVRGVRVVGSRYRSAAPAKTRRFQQPVKASSKGLGYGTRKQAVGKKSCIGMRAFDGTAYRRPRSLGMDIEHGSKPCPFKIPAP